MRYVILKHLEMFTILVSLALGKLLPACLVRLAGIMQESVLLAKLGILLVDFGEAAFQVAELKGLVTIFATGGFEFVECGIVGELKVAVVFLESLKC